MRSKRLSGLIPSPTRKQTEQAPDPMLQATNPAAGTDIKNKEACRLFANISHEIRTPMNGVLGMLTLMLDTELTSEQRSLATMAQTSAENLFELTSDILDLSMIQAGTFSLKQAAFDLPAELEQVITLQSAIAEGKGIDLTVRHPAALHPLIGDAARVRQIATILIGCAIACARHGSVQVAIDAGTGAEQHCRLTLAVSNSGAGSSESKDEAGSAIPAAQEIDSHKYGKNELQWMLCKRLINFMGGEISGEWHPDQPCNFRVVLDFAYASNPLAGVRVLFVEEQPADRQALEHELTQQGLRATGFDSATTALTAMAQAASAGDPYRIAILNHQMAGIDGATIGAALKSDPAYREISLVLLSSAAPDEAQRFAQEGFSAVLGKPVSNKVLIHTLTALSKPLGKGETPPFMTSASFAAPVMPSEQARPFAGYRVLVADDNIVNQQVALRMLEKLGCRADAAINGLQAVSMHQAGNYDLVLMDCQMPELDGFQATAQIRSIEGSARHTPIIAWTAHAMPGEQEKCRVAGMDDFMTKPLRPSHLRSMLDHWLLTPARPAPETAPHADELDAIYEMFGDDFTELADLFQTDSPKRIAALHDASAAGDTAKMASVAHALSGSTASIGATSLAALCKEFEIRAKAGQLDGAAPRLAAIEAEYTRIEARLRVMLAANKTDS